MRVKCPFCFEISNGVIFIDYRDHRPEESMAIPPTIGKSAYLTLKNGHLTAIKPLAEGE